MLSKTASQLGVLLLEALECTSLLQSTTKNQAFNAHQDWYLDSSVFLLVDLQDVFPLIC